MKGNGFYQYQSFERNIFLLLVLLFTAVPATELFILIKLGQTFGLFNTFFLVVGTGVIGAYIAKLQGFYVIRRIQEQMEQGLMPAEEMMDGAMLLLGGLALLTPGLLTDIFGLLLLIPLTRNLLKLFFRKKWKDGIDRQSGVITIDTFSSENEDE